MNERFSLCPRGALGRFKAFLSQIIGLPCGCSVRRFTRKLAVVNGKCEQHGYRLFLDGWP